MSKKLILSLLILWCYRFLPAQSAALSGFPRHFTPQEVGKRLAYHFVDGRHDLYAAKYTLCRSMHLERCARLRGESQRSKADQVVTG
ncbi:hypothetical protein KRR40_46430 [Niabella defluvii]|nr:hypothetical protein KRR40_46430 [Niabella sp. I65]